LEILDTLPVAADGLLVLATFEAVYELNDGPDFGLELATQMGAAAGYLKEGESRKLRQDGQ
jgi:hypothetical protein